MRKIITRLTGVTLCLVLLLCGYFVATGYHSSSTAPDRVTKRPKIPSHLIKNGPYGTNVSITDLVGDCRYQLRAEKLYFKKTRMLAFENALWKKLVAKDLRIAIFENGKKRIELAKDSAELSAGMDHFRIKNPQIRYPEHLNGARMVEIDKKKARIHIHTAQGEKTTWELDSRAKSTPPDARQSHPAANAPAGLSGTSADRNTSCPIASPV
ncbi:MAG: hypothetical protein ACQERN_11405 [Thermodesulfobacteriota bacterium]